jgi:hypothetical protein
MICTPHKYYLDQIKNNEMEGTCSRMGERRGAYMVLVGISEGKIPLGIPRHRW